MVFTKSASKIQKIFKNTITFVEKFRISWKKLGLLAKCVLSQSTHYGNIVYMQY